VATVRTRRQRLGQHFLCDAGTARAVVAALPPEPPRVLEIGAGKGALTSVLLERFPAVRAVELDERLARGLAARIGAPPGLEVRHADALADELDVLAAGGPWQVAGNLPYSVGTAIIRRLLPRRDLFTSLVVMVQLEVAQRLVAPPGGADRGLVSLEAEAYAGAELLFRVPPGRFSPPPKVTSAVVRFVLRPPAAGPRALDAALRLAAEAFLHRRKKLANAVAACAPPEAIAAASGVDGGARPQDLPLAAWVRLGGALPGAARCGRRAQRGEGGS